MAIHLVITWNDYRTETVKVGRDFAAQPHWPSVQRTVAISRAKDDVGGKNAYALNTSETMKKTGDVLSAWLGILRNGFDNPQSFESASNCGKNLDLNPIVFNEIPLAGYLAKLLVDKASDCIKSLAFY